MIYLESLSNSPVKAGLLIIILASLRSSATGPAASAFLDHYLADVFRARLRTALTLNIHLFETLKNRALISSEGVHGFLRRLSTRRGIADVLPPELSELWIIRRVVACRCPLNARRRTIELDQTTNLRSTVREGLIPNIAFANEGETHMALLQVMYNGSHELLI